MNQNHGEELLSKIVQCKGAEEELKRSENRYRAMFDNQTELVCLFSSDGTLILVNQAYCRFFNKTKEEMVGKRWQPVFPVAEDLPEIEEKLKKISPSNPTVTIENRLYAVNGGIRWMQFVNTGFFDPDGNLLEIQSVGRDITEQKQAEAALRESEKRYRMLFNGMTEGFALHQIICDEHGTPYDYIFLEVNPSFERLTGLKRADVVGKLQSETLPNEDPKWVEMYGRVALTCEPCKFENYSPVLKRHFDVFAYSPVQYQFAVLFMDITVRKQAQEQILKLNIELEQRVRERTSQLEASNRELESFCYSVSHDLRSPLRGIDGWSLAIAEDYGDRLDKQGLQYLERIRSESQRMSQLIDDLLTLSRLTRAEMNMESLDLSELAHNIAARIRYEEPCRQVEFLIEPDITVNADQGMMDIVLTNLLGNAWKFTAKREGARIEFGKLRQDEAMIRAKERLTRQGDSLNSHLNPMIRASDGEKKILFIRDNGAGFDMKHAGKLFSPFQRLHRSSEFPGTGIGLATAQRIINRHGGSLWVEAVEDEGAIFFFTL